MLQRRMTALIHTRTEPAAHLAAGTREERAPLFSIFSSAMP